jgi:hypothetical protein
MQRKESSKRQMFLGVQPEAPQVVPSGYICPLTLAIMREPVVDPDDAEGRAVDKSAFEDYQRRFGVRPFTGAEVCIS